MPMRDRALQLRKEIRAVGMGGRRFSAPLSPPPRPPPPAEAPEGPQKITSTEREKEAGHVTRKLRQGLLRSHGSDGSELLFYTHQLHAMECVDPDEIESFLLSYGTGAGKTIIAAGIIASCYRTRMSQQTESGMKICISVPPVLRSQWSKVLSNWLKLGAPSAVLEVKRGDDLTFANIQEATIVLLTPKLLANEFQDAFEKTPPGRWRRKDAPLPPIFSYDFDRLIIDEVHGLKNSKIPLCEAHAELSKRCAKRVGMTATTILSSMADLAGESKALRMPARFRDENAWTDGERGVVNFETLQAFEKYKDEFDSKHLGMAPKTYETVYFRPTLSADAIAKYNKVVKQGLSIHIAKDESEGEAEKKLAQLSTAVRILQHIPVSPQLPLYVAKQLHESPELVAQIADDDGGALAEMLALLRRIRERETGGRVIVTAAFTTHLKVLHAYLNKHAPEEQVLYFDADVSDRGGMVEEFLADENPRCILLLSLGAGGQGLDLVVPSEKQRAGTNLGCTSIVFFGSRQYTASMEEQAEGRIYRIGQTMPVHVYHLLVRGGVDESIGKLQLEKRGLGQAAKGDFSHFASSTGSVRWKRSGGVLRSCLLLDEHGASIVPHESEVKIRKAKEELFARKKGCTGKLRHVAK